LEYKVNVADKEKYHNLPTIMKDGNLTKSHITSDMVDTVSLSDLMGTFFKLWQYSWK